MADEQNRVNPPSPQMQAPQPNVEQQRAQAEQDAAKRNADREAAEERSRAEADRQRMQTAQDEANRGKVDDPNPHVIERGSVAQDDKAEADADKAIEEASKARAKADEARAKADEAGLSEEERAARKAAQDADDAAARAARAEGEANRVDQDTTVEEAGVNAPHVSPDTPAGHHRAVKRSNDPSNPKPAKPEHEDPKLATVKMERYTLDANGGVGATVYTFVHPELVGDYARAGWGRSTS